MHRARLRDRSGGCAPAPAAKALAPQPCRAGARRRFAAAVALCASAALPALGDQGLAAGAGGVLGMAADPAQLVLGRDPFAELRISAPAEVEELSVTASTGKVENVRRLPAGGFAARYRPPAERYPQVAILAAVGRTGAGTVDGWLAVPLAGQGDARVRGEPGSDVSLRIGDRSFGPGRVGEDGVALIPVVVPPGVREAHRGFVPVELRVPETTLLHAAADRQSVQADRSEAVRVFAYVVAPHGAARKGDPPLVEVTRGSLSLRPREPGAYEGVWTIPPGPAGEERATVRLEGLPASKSVVRVTTTPGPAASVVLALDRTALPAGEGEEVQIVARAQDAFGNPTSGPVLLSADAGTLSLEDAAPGLARARLRVDPRFQGREQVMVRARAPGAGASAMQPVILVAGPAKRALLTVQRRYVRAGPPAVLVLETWDAFGNPAPGPPRVTASLGGPPSLEPLGKGRWVLRHGAGPVTVPTPVRFVAELAGARDETELWLVPPPSTQLTLLAAGGGLAGLSGRGSGGQLLGGAELPLPEWLPLSAERALALRLELVAAQASRGVTGGRETQRSALVLAGPVMKGLLPKARWFASGTAGFAVGTAERPGRSSGAGVGLAARLAIGLAVPVRRTAPFLEAAYLRAGGPGGGVSALTLSLGVRLDLFRGDRAQRGE